MKIKTVVENNALNFDERVNKLLGKGWMIREILTDGVNLIAVLWSL